MLFPDVWLCKRLNRVIVVSDDAVPHPVYGWLCDCRSPNGSLQGVPTWVFSSDQFHVILHTKEYALDGFPYTIFKERTLIFEEDKGHGLEEFREDFDELSALEVDRSRVVELDSVTWMYYAHRVAYCPVCACQRTWSLMVKPENKWVCLGCYDREHLRA
jgi:hypothetical protein